MNTTLSRHFQPKILICCYKQWLLYVSVCMLGRKMWLEITYHCYHTTQQPPILHDVAMNTTLPRQFQPKNLICCYKQWLLYVSVCMLGRKMWLADCLSLLSHNTDHPDKK